MVEVKAPKRRKEAGLVTMRLSLMNIPRYFVSLVALIFAVKLILATITPYGFDFALYLSDVLIADPGVAWSPWIIMVGGIYNAWLWLPIHQNDVQALNQVMLGGQSAFLMPTHYLLTTLIKTPLILCDLASSFLVYKLAAKLSSSDLIGRRAALLWFVNPFATLFVEMWGSIDIIIIMLSLVSLLYMIKNRPRLSAFSLFSGIAIRLSPILTWASMVSWLVGQRSDRWRTRLIIVIGPLGIVAYLYWSSQAQILYNFIQFMTTTQLFSAYTPVTQTFSEYTTSELHQLFVTPGLAVMAVTLYYLIAQRAFRKDGWTLVTMTLAGILLIYGFADWSPTAFLWAMPLLAIFNSYEHKYSYSICFYGSLLLYLVAFYSLQLTSDGTSFLFIPVNIIPFGRILVAGLRSTIALRQVGLDVQVRSILAGVSIAYSMFLTWRILRRRA
jgi:hypothetical protein